MTITARRLRLGMYVDGRRVASAVPSVLNGRPMVRVRYADGGSVLYAPDAGVEVKARLELPAGPVAEGWYVASKPKVRVSDGIWRGERDGTRLDTMIGTHRAWAGV